MSNATLRTLAIAIAGSVLVGSAAEAVDFAVTGLYRDKRGTIELPLAPGLGAPPPGIPLSGTVTQTGSGPAALTIPTNFISDPANLEGFLIPIPGVIQLSTSFTHVGPTAGSAMFAAAGGPGNLAYCPGATANPSCTTVAAGGTQGTVNGIITYTAGPNKFGGTMGILLQGSGLLVNKGGALPPTVMTTMGGTISALPFSAQNNFLGGGGGGIIAAGAFLTGSTGMNTNTLSGAPNTHPLGYMTTPKGLITAGPVIGTGTPQSNQNSGFGWTTGTVVVYRTIAAQAGDGGAEKFTTTGFDNRTAAGAGRIQLVAGALQRTFPTDGSDPPEGSNVNRAVITMNLVPQPALPLASPAALMTLGSLVMLSAGYAVTSRRLK